MSEKLFFCPLKVLGPGTICNDGKPYSPHTSELCIENAFCPAWAPDKMGDCCPNEVAVEAHCKMIPEE
jgi:hypothetical protein